MYSSRPACLPEHPSCLMQWPQSFCIDLQCSVHICSQCPYPGRLRQSAAAAAPQWYCPIAAGVRRRGRLQRRSDADCRTPGCCALWRLGCGMPLPDAVHLRCAARRGGARTRQPLRPPTAHPSGALARLVSFSNSSLFVPKPAQQFSPRLAELDRVRPSDLHLQAQLPQCRPWVASTVP